MKKTKVSKLFGEFVCNDKILKRYTKLKYFNDYLKRMRIDEAKRLLEKGLYKTYEVAERSGFGDVKYFMKTFKTFTGMTPKEYKLQISSAIQEDN